MSKNNIVQVCQSVEEKEMVKDEKIKNKEEPVNHIAGQLGLDINVTDNNFAPMSKVDEQKNVEYKADIKENENDKIKNSLDKDFEKNSKIDIQNNINENAVKKNTAKNDNKEKDDEDNNKLMEIENVSNIEKHVEDDIPAIMNDENEGNVQVEEPLESANLNEKTNGAKEKNCTDVEQNDEFVEQNAGGLVLGVNLVKDYFPLEPKDDEQKCEHNADENGDKREENLAESKDNSEEPIQKKRKNEDDNERKFKYVQEIDLTGDTDDDDEEIIYKKRKIN